MPLPHGGTGYCLLILPSNGDVPLEGVSRIFFHGWIDYHGVTSLSSAEAHAGYPYKNIAIIKKIEKEGKGYVDPILVTFEKI